MRRQSLAIIGMLLALGSSLQAQSTSTKKPFKEEELAALLAPVALYPDKVIAQILMASTYPLEVVEANRWLQANSTLKGDALVKEAEKQDWDPSVQSLVSLPDVLKSMDAKIDWTQKVGDAFLAQQKEVMDMIQTLRQKAKKEGNLESSEQLKVTTEPAAPAAAATSTAAAAPQVIIIESAQPNVVYVPTYPPTVYGAWGYPAYPPYAMPPPPGYPGSGFWLGVGVTVAVWNNNNWNNNCNWGGGSINIGEINIGNTGNINRGNINGGGTWQHNPEHRKGTSYRDSGTAAKYDRASNTNSGSRDSYRGHGNTPTASTRDAGAASRNAGSSSRPSATPSTSNRSSASPSTSNRSSGSAFGGMSSGSSASRSSSRGGASRGGGGGRRR